MCSGWKQGECVVQILSQPNYIRVHVLCYVAQLVRNEALEVPKRKKKVQRYEEVTPRGRFAKHECRWLASSCREGRTRLETVNIWRDVTWLGVVFFFLSRYSSWTPDVWLSTESCLLTSRLILKRCSFSGPATAGYGFQLLNQIPFKYNEVSLLECFFDKKNLYRFLSSDTIEIQKSRNIPSWKHVYWPRKRVMCPFSLSQTN